MIPLGRVVALAAISLGLIAGAVFGLDDEETFVSPPEMVAERFVESLAFGRAGPARQLLAEEAKRATPVDNLLRVSRSFRARYGTLSGVRARVEERRGNTVAVRVFVKGSRAENEVRLPILRERGEWKVATPISRLPTADVPARR